jgi:hypothetical protein
MELHPIQEMDETPASIRRIIPVSGGRFAGDRPRG